MFATALFKGVVASTILEKIGTSLLHLSKKHLRQLSRYHEIGQPIAQNGGIPARNGNGAARCSLAETRPRTVSARDNYVDFVKVVITLTRLLDALVAN